MESFIDNIFNCFEPEQKKEYFITRMCLIASKPFHSESTINSVLQVSWNWALEGETALQASSGIKVFTAWSSHNCKLFQYFFTPALVKDVLVQRVKNHSNVPLLLRQGFRIVKQNGSEIHQEHTQIVQNQITSFVYRTQENTVIHNVALFVLECNDCIPVEATDVLLLSLTFLTQLSGGVPPEEIHDEHNIRYMDDIAKVIDIIWKQQPQEVLNITLAQIMYILSEARTDKQSTISMAAVVKYVPLDVAKRIVATIVSDGYHSDESISRLVDQIVEFLQWPTAENVDILLLRFITELAAAKKYTLLINIVNNNVEKIVENLWYPQLRHASLNSLFHMLMGFQHCPKPFHKCLKRMTTVILMLRQERTLETETFLRRFSQLIYSLMYHHAGFPKLYEPVLELIKDYPQPSIDEVKVALNQNKWSSLMSCFVMNTGRPTTLMSSRVQRKLEPGKTGLVNVGNACFFNSAIQALFICDEFCRGILQTIPGEKEEIRIKLQHVFAFLCFTNRPTITPHLFYKASLPAWFQSGQQQDCSEFLKYLLNKLHDNEFSLQSEKTGENRDSDKTLIDRTFYGKVETKIKCSACRQDSLRVDRFLDLVLSFPKSSAGKQSRDTDVESTQTEEAGFTCKDISLNELFSHYFKPENLNGDNQYYCERCERLQDGERSIRIVESPKYLILTLMRFAYDIRQQKRIKLFNNVRYPQTLSLPVCGKPTSFTNLLSTSLGSPQSDEVNAEIGTARFEHIARCLAPKCANSNQTPDLYSLSSVIVHSGSSSACGHYHCYGRHLQFGQIDVDLLLNSSDLEDIDLFPDKWYHFDDGQVSHTTFSTFSKATEELSEETAYILIYRKLSLGHPKCGLDIDLFLPPHVRDAVIKDNEAYLKEQENEARLKQR